MKKRFRIGKLLFLLAVPAEISCRYIGTCRNVDTTATDPSVDMFEPLRHKSRAAALDCQLEAAWSQVLPEHRRESMPLIIE